MNIRVITIDTHYAYQIVKGYKDVENRTFRIKPGKLLIHSSKKHKIDGITPHFPEGSKVLELVNLIEENINKDVSDKEIEELQNKYKAEIKILEEDMNSIYYNSAIIGIVDVVDCIQDSKSIWSIPGKIHWILKNPIMFPEPIKNIVGRQGIFNFDLPKSYNKYLA